MKKLEKLKKITALLKNHGFDEIKWYISHKKQSQINLKYDTITEERCSNDWMYMLEVGYEGKRGCVYLSQPEVTEKMIEEMKEAALLWGREFIPLELEQKECITSFHDHWEKEEGKERILRKLQEACQSAKQVDESIRISKCSYETVEEGIYLLDDQVEGFHETTGYHCFQTGIIAENEIGRDISSGCQYGADLESMDFVHCIREAAFYAIDRIGGEPIPSGSYPVILHGTVMAELLEAYLSSFYGRNILDKRSAICEKTGCQIAADSIILVEDPVYEGGRSTRTLDDEGVPVQMKYLIKDGIFTSALWNQQSAKEVGKRSTGNGFRGSVRSDVTTGVTNIILTSGPTAKMELTDMIKKVENGLFVTGVDGIFAGANTETGAFSLIAKGRVIRDGKEEEPFCEVTIAGNFFDMLMHMTMMAMDEICTEPCNASVAASSVFVGNLTISGR